LIPVVAKKQKSGAVAMGHAMNVVAELWPTSPVLKAMKKIAWIPDGKGGRRPISHPEDLWEAFDIFVLVLPDPYCIQVTTFGTGAPSDRKRKIEKNFIEKYEFGSGRPHCELWAWVSRKGFYTWAWDWHEMKWGPREELKDPTMGRKPQADQLDEVF